jgi:hypothetical protein
MTSNLRIGGLPFACGVTTQGSPATEYDGITLTAGMSTVGIEPQSGQTYMAVTQSGSGLAAAAVPISGVADASYFIGTVIYFV